MAGYTVPANDLPLNGDIGAFNADIGKTVPVHNETVPVNNGGNWANQNNYHDAGHGAEDYGKTMPVAVSSSGIRYVSGWLVCIEGAYKGKDYRLHEDYNYIGRSTSMDVTIDDESISRENHAIIAHDTRKNRFFLAPSSGKSGIYHNGDMVMGNVELKRGDRIEIGRSTFVFVPLCGEDFSWN